MRLVMLWNQYRKQYSKDLGQNSIKEEIGLSTKMCQHYHLCQLFVNYCHIYFSQLCSPPGQTSSTFFFFNISAPAFVLRGPRPKITSKYISYLGKLTWLCLGASKTKNVQKCHFLLLCSTPCWIIRLGKQSRPKFAPSSGCVCVCC